MLEESGREGSVSFVIPNAVYRPMSITAWAYVEAQDVMDRHTRLQPGLLA